MGHGAFSKGAAVRIWRVHPRIYQIEQPDASEFPRLLASRAASADTQLPWLLEIQALGLHRAHRDGCAAFRANPRDEPLRHHAN